MSTATRGRALEYEIRDLFRNAGYSVIRGASSKGELFGDKVDLVASRLTSSGLERKVTVIGVQCKLRKTIEGMNNMQLETELAFHCSPKHGELREYGLGYWLLADATVVCQHCTPKPPFELNDSRQWQGRRTKPAYRLGFSLLFP